MKIAALIISFLLVLLANVAYATHSQHKLHRTAEQIQEQKKFVKKLIEVSSAADKVRASDDINVKSLYRAAQDLYQNAQTFLDDERMDEAAESLFHATEMMFRAVKLAGNQKVVNDNDQRLFEARLKSIDALLKALERIGKEKGVDDKVGKIKSMAEAEIANALALMKTGQPFSARKVIDNVYVEIKTAISELRTGDTLVRSLHFATKEEEYLYELDRNDTHKMLVTLLLEEKMKNPKTKARAKKFLDKAEALRKKAEEYAEQGDYEKAISTCEESTRQIVRAIRSSGFFIPG